MQHDGIHPKPLRPQQTKITPGLQKLKKQNQPSRELLKKKGANGMTPDLSFKRLSFFLSLNTFVLLSLFFLFFPSPACLFNSFFSVPYSAPCSGRYEEILQEGQNKRRRGVRERWQFEGGNKGGMDGTKGNPFIPFIPSSPQLRRMKNKTALGEITPRSQPTVSGNM